jgi:hypothetical protein
MIEMINSKTYTRILYGVTRNLRLGEVSAYEKTAIIKPFNIGGDDYLLWYIVGGSELDNANITYKTK